MIHRSNAPVDFRHHARRPFLALPMALTMALTLLASSLAPTAASAQAGGYAAMVMEADPDAAVYAEGVLKDKPLEIMEFLYPGDVLTVREGKGVTLNYFEAGMRERITGPVTAQVTATKSVPKSGDGDISREAVEHLPKRTSMSSEQLQNFGMVALRDPSAGVMDAPTPLLPADSAVSPGETVPFVWRKVPHASRYQLDITGPEGLAITQETTTNRADVAIPQVPGTYRWRVTALRREGGESHGQGVFTVMNPAETRALREETKRVHAASPAGVERYVALAFIHRLHGHHHGEVRALHDALQRIGDSPAATGVRLRFRALGGEDAIAK